jgi:predicted O-methyltransferase YrrM
MGWLARTLGVRRALEVGVFTGYSSLCVALGATDAHITALDASEEYTAVARRYWKQAGVDGRITLRLGPAVKSLDALVSEGAAGQYDFAFIDADKREYADYYERCLVLLRPGGVILFDNVLWAGHVIDPAATDDDTLAIRALNEQLRADSRIDQVMLPVGDGVTLCRKR